MRRYVSLTLLSALLALLGTGAAWSDARTEEPFEKTVGVSANGRVSVTNTNGHIYVETWNRDEIGISALKRARAGDDADAQEILDEIEIEIRESGGDVDIKTVLPRSRGWFRGSSASVEYEIKVPATVSLDLRSTNGKIGVEGVRGGVELKTTNGGITAQDLGGVVIAETTNGKIEALNVAGPLDAETTNGSITAEVTASSLDDDMSLTTTNGSVNLRVSSGIAARIDARAGNGRVKSDLAMSVEREKKNALSGDLNGGGHTIRIRTSNGSINVREL